VITKTSLVPAGSHQANAGADMLIDARNLAFLLSTIMKPKCPMVKGPAPMEQSTPTSLGS